MAFQNYPAVSGSTYDVAFVANASANTKGTYVALIASSSGDTNQWWFKSLVTTPSRFFLIDVATGGAGSEVVLVANLYALSGADSGNVSAFTAVLLFASIAASTRISGRCQSSSGSAGINSNILAYTETSKSFVAPETYGAITGTSKGTQIDPGGTANTKGAYTQLTASTGITIGTLAVGVSLTATTTATFCYYSIDVSTGAAASEVVVIPDIVVHSADLSEYINPKSLNFPIVIASSTRIAVRAQSSTNNATDRLFLTELVGMAAYPASTGSGGSYGFA